jgi:hypothetical protein
MATIEVNLKEAEKILTRALKANVAVFLSGPPGVGKSAIVEQICKNQGIELTDLRLLLMDPTDLKGLPTIRDGYTKWNRPWWLPDGDDETPRLVFLDEINAAAPTVQASAYQLVQEHRIGEHILPKNTVVWAAGNRVEDRAVVHTMPSPLKSRFLTLHIRVDPAVWLEWAWKNDIDERILGFISWKGDCLADYERVQEESFATPRGWEILSTLLKTESSALPEEQMDEMNIAAAGTIGEGTAAEFMSYIRHYSKLPNIEDVLDGKITFVPENEPALMFALCTAVALKAHGDYKKGKYIPLAYRYANSLPANLAEYATLIGISIYRHYPQCFTLASNGDEDALAWFDKYGSYITDQVALDI